MAAPPKPWEMAGVSGRAVMNNEMQLQSSPMPSSYNTRIAATAPPALPPRPCLRSGYGSSPSYMPYGGGLGSGYSSYGSGGYGGYGGYGSGYGSSYGSYGGFGGLGNQGFGNFYGGYNRMAGNMYGGDVESRFIQLAEESSRPTFNSIESVVGAVGSVAMMLENTFFAMTSSFRAILGVAENFGRLRSLFAQFWSAFAIFRAFNWLIKKLLVLLGIRTEEEFKAWAEATKQTQGNAEAAGGASPKTSSWPAILFLAVIGAVPYIIVKMLGSINASIQSNASDPKSWQNSMQAIAQYDFQASSPQELSFGTHQIITIAPQDLQGNLWNSGWLLASVDQKTSGLVPVNYFKIIKNQFSAPAPQMNALPPISENIECPAQNFKPENIMQNDVSNVEPMVDKLQTCVDIPTSD